MSTDFNIDKERYTNIISEKIADYIEKVEVLKSERTELVDKLSANTELKDRNVYLDGEREQLKDDMIKKDKQIANARKTLKGWQQRKEAGTAGEYDLSEKLVERTSKAKERAITKHKVEVLHNETLFVTDFTNVKTISGDRKKAIKNAVRLGLLGMEALTNSESEGKGVYRTGDTRFQFVALKKGKKGEEKVVGYQVSIVE